MTRIERNGKGFTFSGEVKIVETVLVSQQSGRSIELLSSRTCHWIDRDYPLLLLRISELRKLRQLPNNEIQLHRHFFHINGEAIDLLLHRSKSSSVLFHKQPKRGVRSTRVAASLALLPLSRSETLPIESVKELYFDAYEPWRRRRSVKSARGLGERKGEEEEESI